jgi:nucleotide sugar dehydrogenase
MTDSIPQIQDITDRLPSGPGRQLVCVQGLGFVGAAMATAVAAARRPNGTTWFDVIGVDLDTPEGRERVGAINRGELPFRTTDLKLLKTIADAHATGNLHATTDPRAYGIAAVILIDVNFDLEHENGEPKFALAAFREALRAVAGHMREDALVIVETTVPPGTCARVVAPELACALELRGLRGDRHLLAHAYERVMPGEQYLDSIVNFWRVYAGHTAAAADACEAFLSKVIDVERFPLRRLHSTTASETAKVLENSFRAVTIAMMEEWGQFAEAAGVDLFEVISAIRIRPTHANIRTPGLGVGGYCLTKDPLFASVAAKSLFERSDIAFSFSTRAVETNARMPVRSVDRLESLFTDRGLRGRRLLLLGAAYRPDVGDTRHSPSQIFYEEVRRRGAEVIVHDPLVRRWKEVAVDVLQELPQARDVDALVFAVGHKEYVAFDFAGWLSGARPHVLDTNGVLTVAQRAAFRNAGCRVASIGRGDDV